MKEKKPKTVYKKRHTFYFHLANFVLSCYSRPKYGYKPGKKKFDNKTRPYLFLYNHQTPVDGLLLCQQTKRPVYLVATEDLFTMGFISKFITHAIEPIPFMKSAVDVKAVMTCKRIAKEGHSIALAPEGNRSFTGETMNIRPAVAKLAKLLKIPIAFFVMRGGYDVIPRYADKPRKCGRVTGTITRIMEYDEYKALSDDELYNIIKEELYVDESDDGVICKSNRRAEVMERAVYVCPVCKKIGTLTSKGNNITCSSCSTVATVDKYRHFNEGFPFRTVKEWTDFQNGFINELDIDANTQEPITVENVRFRKFDRPNMKKIVLAQNAPAKLFADRIEIGGETYKFADLTAMTVCGRKRLDFYKDGDTYQIDGANNFCGLKYTNIFYHYKNVKEDGNGFFGI